MRFLDLSSYFLDHMYLIYYPSLLAINANTEMNQARNSTKRENNQCKWAVVQKTTLYSG